jgi:hypothetical protein
MLIGGCPAPQIPQQQPTDTTQDGTDSGDQTPSGGDQNGDGGLDRPVTIPDTEGDGEGDGGTEGSGGSGSGGQGGGGTSGDSSAFLRMSEPSQDETYRGSGTVEVKFFLTFAASTTITKAELIASVPDADGNPSGSPVFVEEQAGLASGENNTVVLELSKLSSLLTNSFGKFVFGMRIEFSDGKKIELFSPGVITVDDVKPTAEWISPNDDHLKNRQGDWTVEVRTSDAASSHTLTIRLDPDLDNSNGNEVLFASQTYPAGTAIRQVTVPLSTLPAGRYYYYVSVADSLEDDPGTEPFYAPSAVAAVNPVLMLTDRLVGEYNLNRLDPARPEYDNDGAVSRGTILQGFNFNDLAGSSMVAVPDMNSDGASELLVGARYGKPNLAQFSGQGWGEAYMIYGDTAQRLRDINSLNSVGTTVSGVTFRGIRVPLNTSWSEGLADITVVDDMDGDDLPELVFSFPRVESVSLKNEVIGIQHPDLMRDIQDLGTLEYDAFNYSSGSWVAGKAQFTRGGIVIVSSHNEVLTDSTQITRKFDRVLDLHEIGQVFTWMKRPGVERFIRDAELIDADCTNCIPDVYDTNGECTSGCEACGGIEDNPDETAYLEMELYWDVWLGGA